MISIRKELFELNTLRRLILFEISALFLCTLTGCVEEAVKVIVIPVEEEGAGCFGFLFIVLIVFGMSSSIFKGCNPNQSTQQQIDSPVSAPAAAPAAPAAPAAASPIEIANFTGYPKVGRYVQNTGSVINEYFQNKFEFSLVSADVLNDNNIIVNFKIDTFSNGKYFFLCNKQNINDSENSREKPYILDNKGGKHEMKGSPMGENLWSDISDNEVGYSPDTTNRFILRPNSTITGTITFPMISEGSRNFTLVIPGIHGWQSVIKIENIQLIQGEPFIVSPTPNNSSSENRKNTQPSDIDTQRGEEQQRQQEAENYRRQSEEQRLAREKQHRQEVETNYDPPPNRWHEEQRHQRHIQQRMHNNYRFRNY